VAARQGTSRLRRAQGRFWTGPVAHLLGGGLDLLAALWRTRRGRRVR
jgi:hypothetical protein